MKMSDSTPICRCRVLYLGSAVPRQSKDGLQGIQEPLRSLYPSEGAIGAKGIDSWLSVWSNGVLLENVDENRKQVTRFFPIDSLHYCAAVRQVLIPERGNSSPEPKFLPLDSPFARTPKAQHPPIFAAILRRTTGIKVLECHVFICKREAAANALVRCCFHAYADNSYARQLENGSTSASVYGTLSKPNGEGWRSRAGSTTTLNSSAGGGGGGGGLMGGRPPQSTSLTNELGEAYTVKNLYASSADLDVVDDGEASIYNGDENHKVWSGSTDQLNGISSLEGPYDIYSGTSSTLGRPSRQRQISAPVPVPPPPKEDIKKKSSSKDKSKRHSLGSQSLSGTLIRPKPIHASSMTLSRQMPPPGAVYQNGGPPHPGHMIYGPLPPPHMMNGGGPRQYHSLGRPLNGGGPHHHHHPPPPGMIPMPIPHPHMMMPAQYATLQHPRAAKGKKHKKDKYNGMPPLGIPVPTPMFHAYPTVAPSQIHPQDALPRPLAMSSRKLAQSAAAGLDDSGNSGAESPNGTGIYRRKGHLNERAFSYSIRQEHRSRSHGSLASLQFNPPDMKKEREIAQMVAGLDLNENGTTTTGHRRSQMNGHAGMNGNANGMPMMAAAGPGSSGTFGKPRR